MSTPVAAAKSSSTRAQSIRPSLTFSQRLKKATFIQLDQATVRRRKSLKRSPHPAALRTQLKRIKNAVMDRVERLRSKGLALKTDRLADLLYQIETTHQRMSDPMVRTEVNKLRVALKSELQNRLDKARELVGAQNS
jgi:hypothetical protein